jgi:hypothetical protein
MQPISFTSTEEQTCFSNLSSNGMECINITKCVFKVCLKKKTNTGSWSGNLNYWTGGVQGSKGLFGWCAGAEFLPLSDNLTWAPGQPEWNKSNENCMHLRVHPNSSKGALLSDKECKNKFILGCQVSWCFIDLKKRGMVENILF